MLELNSCCLINNHRTPDKTQFYVKQESSEKKNKLHLSHETIPIKFRQLKGNSSADCNNSSPNLLSIPTESLKSCFVNETKNFLSGKKKRKKLPEPARSWSVHLPDRPAQSPCGVPPVIDRLKRSETAHEWKIVPRYPHVRCSEKRVEKISVVFHAAMRKKARITNKLQLQTETKTISG